jgi:hypothetical protein
MQVTRGTCVPNGSADGNRLVGRIRPTLDGLTTDELDGIFTRASDGAVAGVGPVRLFWRLDPDGLPAVGWSGMLLDTRDGYRRRLYVAPDGWEAA